MNLVVGARGRLGRSLISHLPVSKTVALDRSVYAGWTRSKAAGAVADFLKEYSGADDVIYIAAGLTDPKRSLEDHLQVNLDLARNIIEGASRQGIRVVTFGTIMEEIVGRDTPNPYFSSKQRLNDYVVAASRGENVLHVRLHTLYGGGAPAPHMFLGQLFDAIRKKEIFRMSAGTQLREYHHVEDDVVAIEQLVSTGATGPVNLSHGAPVQLCALARHVCEQFDCLDRLAVGAIHAAGSENFDRIFERPADLGDIVFRDTLAAVVEDLKIATRQEIM
ncbi:NAD-dependent epimerase/dehydratase family protein [Tardiphaga sp. 215_C5_N2_1]|uniref:NAD-dependent epimerase/dehydratase family protein n=1 Tax=Tardiphaga sp. 215_C5_N2_1 TaxID=3240774 RepID=UPI003F88EE12